VSDGTRTRDRLDHNPPGADAVADASRNAELFRRLQCVHGPLSLGTRLGTSGAAYLRPLPREAGRRGQRQETMPTFEDGPTRWSVASPTSPLAARPRDGRPKIPSWGERRLLAIAEVLVGLKDAEQERIGALRAQGRFFWLDVSLSETSTQDLVEALAIPETALRALRGAGNAPQRERSARTESQSSLHSGAMSEPALRPATPVPAYDPSRSMSSSPAITF
jgi:hypothetical protein